jgi:hypothetical protein
MNKVKNPSDLKFFSATPAKKTEITALGIRHANHVTPLYPQKLALASPTSGGRTVGVVCSRTDATEFVFFFGTALPDPHVHCWLLLFAVLPWMNVSYTRTYRPWRLVRF